MQQTVDAGAGLLDAGDIVIAGGNSYYRDDIARAAQLAPAGIHSVDCGTSGGIVGSWLMDLTADAFARDPELTAFGGQVSDSGEGRWTVMASADEGVPAPVSAAALYQRFESRGQGEYAAKVLSAMRAEFGGHVEKLVRSVSRRPPG